VGEESLLTSAISNKNRIFIFLVFIQGNVTVSFIRKTWH